MVLACACDGLFPLPVQEKAVSWTWRALAMGFSFCLSRKRALWTPYRARRITRGRPKRTLILDRHAEKANFDPSWRACDGILPLPVDEKAHLCTCNGLFPLPVEEKAVSWTSCAFAMAFSPCLSRKRAYRGRYCLFAIAFSLSGRGTKTCAAWQTTEPGAAGRSLLILTKLKLVHKT